MVLASQPSCRAERVGCCCCRICSDPHPCSPPSCRSVCFLPGSDVGKGVPIKTPRGRSGPIKRCAVFPLWDFGEVTEEVSGILGAWEEVPRLLGALLSGPGLSNCFHTPGAQEVLPSPKGGPLLGHGSRPVDSSWPAPSFGEVNTGRLS